MDVYQLTARGEELAHNVHAENKPTWQVVFFLNKRGRATKEQILDYVPGASWHTLSKLRRKGVIMQVGRREDMQW